MSGGVPKEEIAAVVAAAQAGDERAKEYLWRSVRRFAFFQTRRWNFEGYDRSDIMQMAALGFCEALRTYDPTKGASFVVWFGHWVDRHHRTRASYLRSRQPGAREVSWPEMEDSDGDSEPLDPADTRSLPDSMALNRILALTCFNRLSGVDADVIRMRYGLEGHPELDQAEIAARLGVSRQRIQQIVNRAFDRMRGSDVAPPARSGRRRLRAKKVRQSA